MAYMKLYYMNDFEKAKMIYKTKQDINLFSSLRMTTKVNITKSLKYN